MSRKHSKEMQIVNWKSSPWLIHVQWFYTTCIGIFACEFRIHRPHETVIMIAKLRMPSVNVQDARASRSHQIRKRNVVVIFQESVVNIVYSEYIVSRTCQTVATAHSSRLKISCVSLCCAFICEAHNNIELTFSLAVWTFYHTCAQLWENILRDENRERERVKCQFASNGTVVYPLVLL